MRNYVFVTGASSGLGKALALQFAAQGFTVLAGVRRVEDARDLCRLALCRHSSNIVPIVIDLASSEAVIQAAREIDNHVGGDGLAILVNNAGYNLYFPIEFADQSDVSDLFDVLLFGPARLTNALLPAMRRYARQGSRRARVLNVVSWAAFDANPFVGYYAAAKAALLRVTESQHYEFDRYAIDAVAIVPGLMKTPFITRVTSQIATTLNRLPSGGRETYGRQLERMATMSAKAQNSAFVKTPEGYARRIVRIAACPSVRFQYNLGIDTALVETMNRLLPFCMLRRMKFAMFGLGH
jgi:NAD(P)-dependent dehydrogenase (short-subunit alcohol dehydrogenase family)